MKYIVVKGNPQQGFQYFGPYSTEKDANEFGACYFGGTEWWTAPLLTYPDDEISQLDRRFAELHPVRPLKIAPSLDDWAVAIAQRLSDEWDGGDAVDKENLVSVLYEALRGRPAECMRLVGTGIIEEDYFEKLH